MFKTALAFVFIAGVLVVSAATAYRLHGANRDRAIQQFQEQQLHAAHAVAAMLESELASVSTTMRVAAVHLADDREDAGRQMQEVFACAAPPCISAAALYEPGGAVSLAYDRAPAVSADEIQAALSWARDLRGRDRLLRVLSATGGPAIVLFTPVARGSTQQPAVLAAETRLDTLFNRHRALDDIMAGSATLVLDVAGNVVFRSGHREMRLNNVRQRTKACFSCHETFDYLDAMLNEQRGVVKYALHGAPQVAAYAPLDFQGETWVTAIMAPADRASGTVSAQGRQLGMVMVATIFALGLVGHLTWRDGRRQLKAVAVAARRAQLEQRHKDLTALNARLESAAQEWRTTVDTIDAAVVVLQPDGPVERMNRAAAATLPGPTFGWLHEPSDRLRDYAPWSMALDLAREAVERGSVSTARVRDDLTNRTWDLWCRLQQRTDRRTSVVIVARDVTSVIELQESLRRSETMAALGSLVAGVAHEVRNPLFAISSLVDAWSLAPKGDAAPLHEALRHEVGRLKTLMTDLLEYGSPVTFTLRPHRLAGIVDDAVHACAPEAAARRVRLASSLHAEEDVTVDPPRFTRVLINLLQNAIHFAPEDSEVTITTARRRAGAGGVEIAVRDHGRGFREEDLARVFSPFYSRRQGGFGLGLAICERITSEHGGSISAANHPDGGAVVTVVLPLSTQKASL
jgi:signal transduction histidine kinase